MSGILAIDYKKSFYGYGRCFNLSNGIEKDLIFSIMKRA